MSRALVLNATYEPLCIVRDRRAVVLVLAEKAEMLARQRRASCTPPTWRSRCRRSSGCAASCGCRTGGAPRSTGGRSSPATATAASTAAARPRASTTWCPRSRGGGHTWENVVAACRPCNVRKRDRLLDETSMRLRHPPARAAGHELAHVRGRGGARDVDALPADRALTPTPLPGGWSRRAACGAHRPRQLHAEPLPAGPAGACGCSTRPARAGARLDPGRDLVDADEAAAAAASRWCAAASGGGAVLVGAGETAWVDVIVPAGDPLWDDDVGRAARWLGEAWRRAGGARRGAAPRCTRGALACGPLGRLVCFATVGAGEVTTADRRKVVGISQRRTRSAARFQCAAYTRWDPDPLVAPAGAGRRRRPCTGRRVGVGRSPAGVIDASAHLPH